MGRTKPRGSAFAGEGAAPKRKAEMTSDEMEKNGLSIKQEEKQSAKSTETAGKFSLFSLLFRKLERIVFFRQIELRAGGGLRTSPPEIIHMGELCPKQSKMILR